MELMTPCPQISFLLKSFQASPQRLDTYLQLRLHGALSQVSIRAPDMGKFQWHQQLVERFADPKPRSNLSPQYHHQRNQFVLDGGLVAKTNRRCHREQQTRHDVQLNRFGCKQGKISDEQVHRGIALYQLRVEEVRIYRAH